VIKIKGEKHSKKNDEHIENSSDTNNKENHEKESKKHESSLRDIQIDELTNTLKRLQAEFENYKKRADKENVNTIKNANVGLITELLPVLDSFELALKDNQCSNEEVQKYRKGIELIYSQLYSILQEQGLRTIDTKNHSFDLFKHEVLMVKECNEPDDRILQEFQKGYMLNENIIRHSKVMIAKHVDEKKE
jgi:molecular chaperone GrpE